MKTETSIKAGSIRNHNEKIARAEKVAKNDPERNNRQQGKHSNGHGIKVMSIRTGIKAGWVSRNYK
jgi:hypothetical protein